MLADLYDYNTFLRTKRFCTQDLFFFRINCAAELFCSRTAGGSLAPQNDVWVRSQTGHPPSLILENLTGLSSCYLATFSASMETDVREVKGNSEIQTSVSLH